MKQIKYFFSISLAALILFSTNACKKDPDPVVDETKGKISINFQHKIDGDDIMFDTMAYINAAGNEYMLYVIQYFVTDLTVYKNGEAKIMDGWTDMYYVDTDEDYTLKWDVYDELEPGTYDSLAFHFGIPDEKNQSFMFVNQPESNMVWPEYLGGGYHYMKIDGKWRIDSTGQLRGFAFHLGQGQTYNSNDEITGFYDLSFRVSIDNSSFTVVKGERTQINLIMNVEEWFKNPHVYNHNVWGGDIMETPEAMELVAENGRNVFTFSL